MQLDLEGVDPERRAEVARRVGIILDYLRLDEPTAADDEHHGALVGIGAPAFRLLVRAWLEHGKPAKLPLAKARRAIGFNRRTPLAAKRIVAHAILKLGARARATDVMALITSECAKAGVAVPAYSAVRRALLRERGKQLPTTSSDGPLIVDHCALNVAVAGPSGTQRPVATVAMRGGYIFAHALTLHAPAPQTTAAVLAELVSLGAGAPHRVPLRMNSDYTRGWNALLTALSDTGVTVEGRRSAPVPSSGPMRAIFGDAIGGMKLSGSGTSQPTKRPIPRVMPPSVPATLEEAQDAFDHAVRLSNSRFPSEAQPSALTAPVDAMGLISRLRVLAAEPIEPARLRQIGRRGASDI